LLPPVSIPALDTLASAQSEKVRVLSASTVF